MITQTRRYKEAMTEGVRAYAVNAETAEALWKKSEEMVGESF
jgi:hypothetical protein